MKQLQEIRHCMYHDVPRRDIGCLHCSFSLKIGAVWTCWYKPKAADITQAKDGREGDENDKRIR